MDFTQLLSAITNHMGRNLQRPIYKEGRSYSEAQFQTEVLTDLRMQLGEEVEEAPRQGGDLTDIKYKSVVLELTVEKRTKTRNILLESMSDSQHSILRQLGLNLG